MNRILAGALVLGLAADALLRVHPWRLNLFLWVCIASVVAVVWAGVGRAEIAARDQRVLLGAAILFAACFLLRDAEMLYVLGILATLTTVALVAWRRVGGSPAAMRVSAVALAWVHAVLVSVFGAFALLYREARAFTQVTDAPWRRRALLVGVGMLAALPPVVIVGALLSSADPSFGALLTAWTTLPFEEAVQHAIIIAVFAWPTAGWLRAVASPTEVPPAALELAARRPGVDFLVVGPGLYMLAALLAAYLGVQARALFGGAAYVEMTTGLTYSEYARQGFFELVVVTGIVLVVLAFADWLVDRSDESAVRRYRSAAWLLIGLIAVLIASAVQRMALYVGFYGLTEERLYALAAMVWIAAALAWFAGTVLRGDRTRFAIGVLATSAAWLLALNVLNPERVVVATNVARALADVRTFDAKYHAGLSADAVPSVLDAARQLRGPVDRCEEIVRGVHEQWAKRFAQAGWDDWRTWSVPRARVERLVDVPLGELLQRHCG